MKSGRSDVEVNRNYAANDAQGGQQKIEYTPGVEHKIITGLFCFW